MAHGSSLERTQMRLWHFQRRPRWNLCARRQRENCSIKHDAPHEVSEQERHRRVSNLSKPLKREVRKGWDARAEINARWRHAWISASNKLLLQGAELNAAIAAYQYDGAVS